VVSGQGISRALVELCNISGALQKKEHFKKRRSVTAKIGLCVESDLSMYFQEILETNLLGLFGVAGNT
jgi:hypothetical protein